MRKLSSRLRVVAQRKHGHDPIALWLGALEAERPGSGKAVRGQLLARRVRAEPRKADRYAAADRLAGGVDCVLADPE